MASGDEFNKLAANNVIPCFAVQARSQSKGQPIANGTINVMHQVESSEHGSLVSVVTGSTL